MEPQSTEQRIARAEALRDDARELPQPMHYLGTRHKAHARASQSRAEQARCQQAISAGQGTRHA